MIWKYWIKIEEIILLRLLNLLIKNCRNGIARPQEVYLISDTKTGKLYVGSAYGENGIWGVGLITSWLTYTEITKCSKHFWILTIYSFGLNDN